MKNLKKDLEKLGKDHETQIRDLRNRVVDLEVQVSRGNITLDFFDWKKLTRNVLPLKEVISKILEELNIEMVEQGDRVKVRKKGGK